MTANGERHWSYALCGWHFRSEIRIEALPSWDGGSQSPVDIELIRGSVPEVPCEYPIAVFASSPDNATVVAADAGRFSADFGTRVVADVRPGALPGFVETIIVGPVLGALSYQRGVLPLHCNTVVINGNAVALAGHSGAGK